MSPIFICVTGQIIDWIFNNIYVIMALILCIKMTFVLILKIIDILIIYHFIELQNEYNS